MPSQSRMPLDSAPGRSRLVLCATLLMLAAGVVLIPAPASAACDGTTSGGGAASIEVGGVRRTFTVRLPSPYDGRTAAPVVFAFHPFGMNAQYMQTRVPMSRAWREAIAVYPDGLAGNGAPPSWQGSAGANGDRDLLFFDAMLAYLREHACIDARRIYAIGYSNGAMFTGVLACERGEVLAAVALASGRQGCEPKGAMPVALSHGTADTTVPYEQALQAARTWSSRNRCKAPPKPTAPGCVVADDCTAAPVTLCTYAGGHEYNAPFTATAVELFKGSSR